MWSLIIQSVLYLLSKLSIHEIRCRCYYKILIFNEIELFDMNCVCCEDKVHEFELVLKWIQKAFLDFYFPFPFNQCKKNFITKHSKYHWNVLVCQLQMVTLTVNTTFNSFPFAKSLQNPFKYFSSEIDFDCLFYITICWKRSIKLSPRLFKRFHWWGLHSSLSVCVLSNL